MKDYPQMKTYTRSGSGKLEAPYEKPVIVTEKGDLDISRNFWAEVRFATEIMAEHGTFFTLLMPPEVASKEREEAMKFAEGFTKLFTKIDGMGPEGVSDVKSLAKNIIEEYKPFIEYKERNHQAQVKGKLRSLVWPLFFDHTKKEAERWVRRFESIAKGDVEYDRDELIPFWTMIMDEHARFIAHLLDPDEYELIDKAMDTGKVFAHLHEGGIGGTVSAATAEPGTVAESMIMHPEMDAVKSAAQTILDFKTQAAREIEAGKIRSIIDPRLADHVRREALKFYDELQRV